MPAFSKNWSKLLWIFILTLENDTSCYIEEQQDVEYENKIENM